LSERQLIGTPRSTQFGWKYDETLEGWVVAVWEGDNVDEAVLLEVDEFDVEGTAKRILRAMFESMAWADAMGLPAEIEADDAVDSDADAKIGGGFEAFMAFWIEEVREFLDRRPDDPEELELADLDD
jgi:hypothetical protein